MKSHLTSSALSRPAKSTFEQLSSSRAVYPQSSGHGQRFAQWIAPYRQVAGERPGITFRNAQHVAIAA